MEYPAELLPQTAYQVIETRELPDSAAVLRRIDSDCTDVRLDDFGEVPATVLVGHESLSRANGLSVSLCGKFKPAHLAIRAVPSERWTEPHASWTAGQPVPTADEINYELYPAFCCASLRLGAVQGMRFPTKNDRPDLKSESLSGRLFVEHKPTVTNFWHCELSFYEDRGNLIRPSKSAWKKKAYEFVLRNLAPMVHLGSDQLSCPPLSRDLYTL